MNTFEAIILGLVQGLTEFLPISSSGHLVFLENILKIEGDLIFFDLLLHLGTLFAVMIFYRKTIFKIIKKPFSPLTLNLIIATIPTILIGVIFKDFFEKSFSGNFLFVGFLITAIFLIINQTIQQKYILDNCINPFNAFVIGVFQGIAITPGISRSGSTITAGIAQGINKEEITEFSFLLSIPVILGGTILKFFDVLNGNIVFEISIFNSIIAMFFAFLSGIFAIKIMTKIIKENKYYIFSIYLILVSILVYILEINAIF